MQGELNLTGVFNAKKPWSTNGGPFSLLTFFFFKLELQWGQSRPYNKHVYNQDMQLIKPQQLNKKNKKNKLSNCSEEVELIWLNKYVKLWAMGFKKRKEKKEMKPDTFLSHTACIIHCIVNHGLSVQPT